MKVFTDNIDPSTLSKLYDINKSGLYEHIRIMPDVHIVRKGACKAIRNIIIPMNMRDGLLICLGKENEDWNYSAPHGAGRITSRA